MDSLDRILAEHPFFAGMKPEMLAFIAGCASNVRFEAGEYIFREGEPAEKFYVIRYGHVALEMHRPEKGPIIIETISSGEVLGWSWLVSPFVWHFDARAIDNTRAIAIDGQCLRQKCEEDHDLGYEIYKRIAMLMESRLQSTRLQLMDVYGQ
jgi:CRP-like cAMP-binding protein